MKGSNNKNQPSKTAKASPNSKTAQPGQTTPGNKGAGAKGKK